MTRGWALFPTVMVASALVSAAGPTTDPTATAGARLKTINSRVDGKGASLVIEVTDPVGYVAARPDPFTLTLDFRNVDGRSVANAVVRNAKSPIAAVAVESTDSMGTPGSRVRVTLAQPVAHRVRSQRNTIVVDFDRPSGRPFVLPPAPTAAGSPAQLTAPDAMKALEMVEVPAVDPLAALGLIASPAPQAAVPPRPSRPGAPDGSREIRSVSIFRAPISAPCFARSPRSAA